MKILMGNNSLSLLAGSETWTLTLAVELKRLGHSVTAYSPSLGIIAAKLEAVGVRCVNHLKGSGIVPRFNPVFEEEEDVYDVAICNHNQITKDIKLAYPNLPIIATVHGIIHENEQTHEIWPEHPVTEFRVEQYVAVSEEVQDILKTKYGIESVIIRNFFDLERFKPSAPLRLKPEVFLVNSNYWGKDDQVNQIIKEVANHYNARFMGIGANFVPTYEVDDIIKEADIVFGMGRSIMEAVCMGKIGVVHGRWGTGGVITPESMLNLRKTNYSGRIDAYGKYGVGLASPEAIIKEIDIAYNQANADCVRGCVEADHNVKRAALEYLKIAEKICGGKK